MNAGLGRMELFAEDLPALHATGLQHIVLGSHSTQDAPLVALW